MMRQKIFLLLFCGKHFGYRTTNQPPHDKTNKMSVRPAKTQISLGIRPVWSESSLSAWRNLGSLATYWAHSEDSDQTWRMSRLIWVFAGRTLTLLVLSCCGSNKLVVAKKQFLKVSWHWEGIYFMSLHTLTSWNVVDVTQKNWAEAWQNQQNDMCDQRRHRLPWVIRGCATRVAKDPWFFQGLLHTLQNAYSSFCFRVVETNFTQGFTTLKFWRSVACFTMPCKTTLKGLY